MSNVLTQIPARWRQPAYVAYSVGSVFVSYLGAKEILGSDEVALWTGLGAVLGVTAAANVTKRRKRRGRHERADV